MSSSDFNYFRLEAEEESQNLTIENSYFRPKLPSLKFSVVVIAIVAGLVLACAGLLILFYTHRAETYVRVSTSVLTHLSEGSTESSTGSFHKYTTEDHVTDEMPTEHWLGSDLSDEVETTVDSLNNNSILQTTAIPKVRIDPCENFYEFACGDWKKEHPVAPNAEYWASTWNSLLDRVKDVLKEVLKSVPKDGDIDGWKQAMLMYDKCMTIENQTKEQEKEILGFIWRKLESYGGWPILYKDDDSWNTDNFSWEKSVADLLRIFQRPTILNVFSRQTSDAYLDPEIAVPLAEPVSWLDEEYIVNVTKVLMDFKGQYELKEDYIVEQVANMTKFYNDLHKHEVYGSDNNHIEMYGFDLRGGEMPLSHLQNMIDAFVGPTNEVNLKQLLQLIYEKTRVEISDDQKIYVHDVGSILRMLKFVQGENPRTLANYLHFQMLQEMIGYSTLELRELHYLFAYETSTYTVFTSKVCEDFMRTNFTLALAKKYVEKEFKDASDYLEHKNEVKRMFNQIKDAFHSLKNDSFDLESANNRSDICIGFPDWITNGSRVQMEYEGLVLNKSTYLEQILLMREWSTDRELRRLNEPKVSQECYWLQEELFDSGSFNQIVKLKTYIPDGLLRPPFFSLDPQHQAANYGGLGAILGHELVHGLATYGWETSRIFKSLKPAAVCLRDQYDGFGMDGLHNDTNFIDGSETVDENFADNGGLKLAYYAFKQEESLNKSNEYANKYANAKQHQLTNDQTFFLSFAQCWCESFNAEHPVSVFEFDGHSPGSLRVLGTLQNSQEFADAWNCPVGSIMNPSPNEHPKCNLFSDNGVSRK